ncbi:MAG: polysaccharide deacetylase family protein [FCB group bacterium]|jgi:predicted glycoside hydrolase/deacetylase ChbG (UPF0249 family)|nr:polysaccharide deacetylase family protein [FCB group bacterium]
MRLRFASLCLLAVLLTAAWTAGAEPTYAERLGWPADARVVLFHSDDAGMSHASNLGTIRAIEEGVVTSASIMMPCPWVPEFVKYVKEHPEVDAGVHLTMNSEWDLYRWGPVAGKPAVPGLCDPDGYLWDNGKQVVENATPDEVEREIRAQIEKLEGMGIKPTHIDSHMGTLFATPEFAERYYKVGIEKQIPVLAMAGHLTHVMQEQDTETIDAIKQLAEMAWDKGLPVLDDLHTASYDWQEGKGEKFVEMLSSLKPGITMIIVHATDPTDEIPLITPSAPKRYEDTKGVVDPAVRKAIEEKGIIMTTWRELKQRRDKVGEAKP